MKHAALSASSSHRWLACPASVRMSIGLPDSGSIEAMEGSVAHRVAELALTMDVDTHRFLDTMFPDYEGVTVTTEMTQHAQQYVDYCNNILGDKVIEQRVDYSKWVEGGFGTLDFASVDKHHLSIVDFKFGRLPVDAKENPQLMLYALGLSHQLKDTHDIQYFELTIHQSRINHFDTWHIDRKTLHNWAEEVARPRAALALAPDAPFNPGEKQCRYCPAKGHCRAFAKFNLTRVVSGLPDENGNVSHVETLAVDEIATVLENAKSIRDWLDAVETMALTKAASGEAVPGFKIVESRKWRQWRDEVIALQRLSDITEFTDKELTTTHLKSPAQVEKALGCDRALVDELTIRPKGKPLLVPETDKRQPIQL